MEYQLTATIPPDYWGQEIYQSILAETLVEPAIIEDRRQLAWASNAENIAEVTRRLLLSEIPMTIEIVQQQDNE